MPPKACVQAVVVPKTETGGWKTVKAEKATFSNSGFRKVQKPNRFTSIRKVSLSFWFLVIVFPIFRADWIDSTLSHFKYVCGIKVVGLITSVN